MVLTVSSTRRGRRWSALMSPIFEVLLSQWCSSHRRGFQRGYDQLNALAEADIMSSELTYVIVKPCGLTMAVGAQKELTVGHDDKMTELPNSIARADVASLCA